MPFPPTPMPTLHDLLEVLRTPFTEDTSAHVHRLLHQPSVAVGLTTSISKHGVGQNLLHVMALESEGPHAVMVDVLKQVSQVLARSLARRIEYVWTEANAAKLTPLHLAAKNGRLDMVSALLDAGAPPSVESAAFYPHDRHTPLHLALLRGHDAVARMLMAAGARLEECEQKSKHPLHDAVRRLDVARVETLLAMGMSPRSLEQADGALGQLVNAQAFRSKQRATSAKTETAALAMVDTLLAAGLNPAEPASRTSMVNVLGFWLDHDAYLPSTVIERVARVVVNAGPAPASLAASKAFFVGLRRALCEGPVDTLRALRRAGVNFQGSAQAANVDSHEFWQAVLATDPTERPGGVAATIARLEILAQALPLESLNGLSTSTWRGPLTTAISSMSGEALTTVVPWLLAHGASANGSVHDGLIEDLKPMAALLMHFPFADLASPLDPPQRPITLAQRTFLVQVLIDAGADPYQTILRNVPLVLLFYPEPSLARLFWSAVPTHAFPLMDRSRRDIYNALSQGSLGAMGWENSMTEMAQMLTTLPQATWLVPGLLDMDHVARGHSGGIPLYDEVRTTLERWALTSAVNVRPPAPSGPEAPKPRL